LQAIAELAREYQLRVANVFHAGDGNMHPLILFDANQPGELERAEAFGGRILELCVAVGGSITGEHGVGREKINQMCAQCALRQTRCHGRWHGRGRAVRAKKALGRRSARFRAGPGPSPATASTCASAAR
jgi:hypothetical protein